MKEILESEQIDKRTFEKDFLFIEEIIWRHKRLYRIREPERLYDICTFYSRKYEMKSLRIILN